MTSIRPTFGRSIDVPEPSLMTAPQPAATSNQFDDNNNSLRKISTIMPAFLIGFVCFLAIFLACGIYHSRRRRRMREVYQRAIFLEPTTNAWDDALQAQRPKKKKKRVTKPKLWEVDVKAAGWERDLEALLPVAAELQNEAKPSPLSSPAVVPLEQSRKRWFFSSFSRSNVPLQPQLQPARPLVEPLSPIQQAQVAFIVSMPAPNRAPGQPSQEILLGTTQVPYRRDQEDNVDYFNAEEFARKIEYAV